VSSIRTQVFLKDDDKWRIVHLKDDSCSVIGVDYDACQLFVSSREQAERLFDAAAEVAGKWREREPDQATVDAVIGDEPVEVLGRSGSVIGYTLPGRGEAMFPTREDALSFEDRLNANLDAVGDAIKGMKPASR
jgi:hypothetical protein